MATFDAISSFHTYLCGVFRRGETRLPLSDEAVNFLAGLALACPAQLVLFDGVNREVIEWQVVDGQVIADRAQGGTDQYNFPAGTELRFEWTPDNVTRETVGCP